MDANDPDDLNDLESRLSCWQPTADGLDAEAMLFAAGRASVRSGFARYFWPALACCTTALAIGLALWLGSERTERQMLAERLRQQLPAPSPSVPSAPPVGIPPESPVADELSPDSFLATHRALEHGLESWPPRALVLAEPSLSPAPNPFVLRAGQRDALLDP